MLQFHHHPDGLIYLRTEAGTYCDTVENFQLDSGGPYEGLPAGMIERRYTPGVQHCFITAEHDQTGEGAPMPWPAGDGYLDAYADIVAAKEARLAAYRRS